MSKKIVLRSVYAIAMIGLILSVSSCDKDEKKIIGVWEYESVILKDFSCSDPSMTVTAKATVQESLNNMIGSKIEFTKKGVTISLNDGSMGTYKIEDHKLILGEGSGFVQTYDLSFPEKKKMQMETDLDAFTLVSLSLALFDGHVEVNKCSYQTTLIKK